MPFFLFAANRDDERVSPRGGRRDGEKDAPAGLLDRVRADLSYTPVRAPCSASAAAPSARGHAPRCPLAVAARRRAARSRRPAVEPCGADVLVGIRVIGGNAIGNGYWYSMSPEGSDGDVGWAAPSSAAEAASIRAEMQALVRDV